MTLFHLLDKSQYIIDLFSKKFPSITTLAQAELRQAGCPGFLFLSEIIVKQQMTQSSFHTTDSDPMLFSCIKRICSSSHISI